MMCSREGVQRDVRRRKDGMFISVFEGVMDGVRWCSMTSYG